MQYAGFTYLSIEIVSKLRCALCESDKSLETQYKSTTKICESPLALLLSRVCHAYAKDLCTYTERSGG